MKLILNSQFAFTLIEVLIVATLVGIMGLVTTELLSRTFKASNRVQVITKVKENGQSAINQIDETLRFAQEVTCINQDQGGNSVMVVKTKDGSYISFYYYKPVKNSCDPISNKNGVLTLKTSKPAELNSTEQALAICSGLNLSNHCFLTGQALTDYSDIVKGVSVNSANFSKTTSTNGKDVVNITIEIGPAVNSPIRPDEQVTTINSDLTQSTNIKFQTSIVLR